MRAINRKNAGCEKISSMHSTMHIDQMTKFLFLILILSLSLFCGISSAQNTSSTKLKSQIGSNTVIRKNSPR